MTLQVLFAAVPNAVFASQGEKFTMRKNKDFPFVLSLCLLISFNLLAIRTVKPCVDPKQRILLVHICDGNRRC